MPLRFFRSPLFFSFSDTDGSGKMTNPFFFADLGFLLLVLRLHFRFLGFGFCLICLFAECWFKGLSIDGVLCVIVDVLCLCLSLGGK